MRKTDLKPTCSKVGTVKKCGRVKQSKSTKKLIPSAAASLPKPHEFKNPIHCNYTSPQPHTMHL